MKDRITELGGTRLKDIPIEGIDSNSENKIMASSAESQVALHKLINDNWEQLHDHNVWAVISISLFNFKTNRQDEGFLAIELGVANEHSSFADRVQAYQDYFPWVNDTNKLDKVICAYLLKDPIFTTDVNNRNFLTRLKPKNYSIFHTTTEHLIKTAKGRSRN